MNFSDKQLSFITDTWIKHYSEEELKFDVDMAIAMDYVIFERGLAEDFKVNEEKLDDIKERYEGIIPKIIEQIEKKETNKSTKGQNVQKKI